jgi:mRNA interferase MazF
VTYDRYDVILVQFPFTEKRGQKQRPAIVLTDRDFNNAHLHAVTAMVTTASNTRWASDLHIAAFAEAGLRSPCFARMKLFTVAEDLIIGRIGTLAQQDQTSMATAIRFLFGT